MRWLAGFLILGVMCGCQQASVAVYGQWLTTPGGEVLKDPQSSGLDFHPSGLLMISDHSAAKANQMRLHRIDTATGQLGANPALIRITEAVSAGCFGAYLNAGADFEGMVVDPDDPSLIYVVTEDASKVSLSPDCVSRFGQNFSTDFPSLLLRLALDNEGQAHITHARPLGFKPEHRVGNFPNDGFEGLAIDDRRTLYLGREKDADGKARIFRVQLHDDFWRYESGVIVEDAELNLPYRGEKNHPINGMTYYRPRQDHPGFLLAAARNDDELWVVDLNRTLPARVIKLAFYAPTHSTECEPFELMDNASIEGFAVRGDRLWIVNDPWKVNYLKNLQCPANKQNYMNMAGLVFSLPLDPQWFN